MEIDGTDVEAMLSDKAKKSQPASNNSNKKKNLMSKTKKQVDNNNKKKKKRRRISNLIDDEADEVNEDEAELEELGDDDDDAEEDEEDEGDETGLRNELKAKRKAMQKKKKNKKKEASKADDEDEMAEEPNIDQYHLDENGLTVITTEDDDGDDDGEDDDDGEAELQQQKDELKESRRLNAQLATYDDEHELRRVGQFTGRPRGFAPPISTPTLAAITSAAEQGLKKAKGGKGRLRKAERILPLDDEEDDDNNDDQDDLNQLSDADDEGQKPSAKRSKTAADGKMETEHMEYFRSKPKQLTQTTISRERLVPKPSATTSIPALPAAAAASSSRRRDGTWKPGGPDEIVLGSRVRIGNNIWVCTYRGHSVNITRAYDAKTDIKDQYTPDCFSTFFNETIPTVQLLDANNVKTEYPNYEVFFISTNTTVNPQKVTVVACKKCEQNLEHVAAKAYPNFVTELVNKSNVFQDKTKGVYRLYTSHKSYIGIVQLVAKHKQKAAAAASGATPASSSAKKPSASAAAASSHEQEDELKKRLAFLNDNKWVSRLFSRPLQNFVDTKSGEELETLFGTLHAKWQSILEGSDDDETGMEAFNRAKVLIGKHTVDIGFMLPFVNDHFRKMVTDKIADSLLAKQQHSVMAEEQEIEDLAALKARNAAKPKVPITSGPVLPPESSDRYWLCDCGTRTSSPVCEACKTPKHAKAGGGKSMPLPIISKPMVLSEIAASAAASLNSKPVVAVPAPATAMKELGWVDLSAAPSHDEAIKMAESAADDEDNFF
jgi:hypothetical protein